MDHDHLPALIALLYLAPSVVLLLALVQALAARGWAPAVAANRQLSAMPASSGLASLLLLVEGTIHAGLAPGHLQEPVLALLFSAAALVSAFLAAAIVVSNRWRAPAALLLVALLAAYGWTLTTGLEVVDVLGIVACAIELAGLVVLACPSSRGPFQAGLNSASRQAG